MKVQVIRGLGNKQSEPLINPLCTTEGSGRELGRNHLDENGFNKIAYSLTLPYRNIPLPGKLCQVNDASLGQTFKAKILSVKIGVSNLTGTDPIRINTSVSIERSIIE